MSKEIINKEQMAQVFCQALLAKNTLIGYMSQLNDCYAQSGLILPEYSHEYVAELQAKMDEQKEIYDKSLNEFKECFSVDFKQYAKYVVNFFKTNYKSKVKLISKLTSEPGNTLYCLTFKNDIPELGIDKNTVINLAVVDTKKQKANIIEQCFVDNGTSVPLLHFCSKKSRLLIPEKQSGIYANKQLIIIANAFIQEYYIDEKSQSLVNL